MKSVVEFTDFNCKEYQRYKRRKERKKPIRKFFSKVRYRLWKFKEHTILSDIQYFFQYKLFRKRR